MRKGKIKIWRELIKMSRILLWRDKITVTIIYTSVLLNLGVWVIMGWLLKYNSQGVIIEHYNVFFGIDMMVDMVNGVSWWEILFIPLGGLIFLVLSFVMSVVLMIQFNTLSEKVDKKVDNLISNRSIGFISSRLLLIGAWILQLILLVYGLMILRIN